MRSKTEQHDVGIIVGRFQVPELHQAHKDLIEEVCAKHDKVIIFLGLSPLMVTQENPLDFEARKQMILEEFPNVNILYIKDIPNDDAWSKRLDGMIEDVITPSQKPVLYGGRDSFIAHYSGKWPTHELEPDTYVRFSGTEVRREIARKSTKASPEFRAGVVWASQSRFPTCYPTVDMVIFDEDHDRILLGKKTHEDGWRILGGFADPQSPSYEADVRRETHEEAGIEVTDPIYIGSFIIDDWRYRREIDKIKTLLFVCKKAHGSPRPGDDIAEVKWFDVIELEQRMSHIVMPHHIPLLKKALEWNFDNNS